MVDRRLDRDARRRLSICAVKPLGRARAEGEEMTKTPGEVEPPKPITKAQRDARKASMPNRQ
jgi:hypothetical protein